MSILLNAEELRVIKETVTAEYRAMQWRSFLPIDRSVPTWAEDYKIITIEGVAPKPQLVNDPANRPGPNRLPMPRISRRETLGKIYKFALRYDFTDEEQVRYQRLGIQIATEKAKANSESFEEMLERIAFNGASTDTETAGLFGDIGLANIATGSADVLGAAGSTAMLVTERPKAAGSGGTGWFDLSSGAPTATATEMALDLVKLADSVRRSTLDRNRCTDIVLADALWTVANQTVSGIDSQRNAIRIAQEMLPGVQIRPWYKLDSAGVSSRHRIMALDASDPHGPRMVLPQEMSQDGPYDAADHLGMFVNQTLIVGGLLVKKPQVVCYMDPVNQA